MAMILCVSCSKEHEEPSISPNKSSTSLNSVEKNSSLQLPDSAWYDEYEKMVFDNNVFIDLLASNAISKEEFQILELSFADGKIELEDLRPYLSMSEYEDLSNYHNELLSHLSSVKYNSNVLTNLNAIHERSTNNWAAEFPIGHYLAGVSDCEQQASEAAVETFSVGMATAVGAGIMTGGAGAVPVVVGTIFGSVASYAYNMATC